MVGGLVLLVDTSGARCGQQSAGKGLMAHSDQQLWHRKPPLFPSPETVQSVRNIAGFVCS